MWTIRDKTCVITGASSGIGKFTALGLARQGAKLALVGRNRQRTAAVAKKAQHLGSPQVTIFIADISIQSQVRRIAQEMNEHLNNIHVLIHNVGVVMPFRKETPDGMEATFASNHLAAFLLTHLLLDRVHKSAHGRIIVVASQVESRGTIDFDDLHFAHTQYMPLRAYDRSKLANVLFTYELARRLHNTNVTANCLHPGVIATNLLSDYMGSGRIMTFIHKFIHPGPKQGAQVSIRVATDASLTTTTGAYFRPGGESRTSNKSYDTKIAKRLWEVSEQLTGVSS